MIPVLVGVIAAWLLVNVGIVLWAWLGGRERRRRDWTDDWRNRS